MSDVPTLFVTICAAVMLVSATSVYVNSIVELDADGGMADFGLFAGFSTIIRPTNAVILVVSRCVS